MNKYEQARSVLQFHSDDIDLVEIFRHLWRGRTAVLLIAGCTTLLALAYAFAAPQKWTSIAYVMAPRVEDIAAYLERRRTLARADKEEFIDAAAFASGLFDEFVELSATPLLKQRFLSETKEFIERQEGLGNLEATALLEHMARITPVVSAPQKNQIVPYYKISFATDSPQAAQRNLKEYIEYVNARALERSDSAFLDRLKAGIQARKASLAEIESGIISQRASQIIIVETALYTAKQAGVTDYAVGLAVPGNTIVELRSVDRLFMLGEKYLTAELQALRERPLVYPPRYHEIQYELKQLEALQNHQLTPSLSYRYQLTPTYPTSRDSPKRLLIIVLGVLLGSMLGCFWVLIMGAIKRSQSAPHPPLQPSP
ncbi:Wzz/FepE/Etk N-terminal domain-containing protein [Pollutimonas sp. H1-120]|uniref:LPS O-antigen chain length determinant protein WzzB n=1 Tax=Pollutimonas sp. H1-120 TaxID=3148824 RepID=UPI003B51729D